MPNAAVIFDFNGVIADDEHLHQRAFASTLAAANVTLTPDDYFETYLGLDDQRMLQTVFRHKLGRPPSASELEQLLARKDEAYLQQLDAGVQLHSGAAELIVELADEWPLAVASGARRHEIERILREHELLHHFTTIVSADDVAHSKPHPAPYLAALEQLRQHGHPKLAPHRCVVIEDAPAGIEAALAAGMIAVAVATSRTSAELGRAKAVVDVPASLSRERVRRLLTDANS